MHLCSNRQCIYVSLQSPLIYHAISAKRMLSFQCFLFLFFLSFFLFSFFFFFLLTTAYSCAKVFVSTVYVVAGSFVMHHLLGSVVYALFFKNGSIKQECIRSSDVLLHQVIGGHSLSYHAHRYTVSPCRSHVFFSAHYTASVFPHPCINNIHRARVIIGCYLASAKWPQVCTVDRVCIFAEPQTRQISTRPTVRTEGHIHELNMYTLNSEPKALTGDKSEGIKSRGAAEAFIRGFSPVKAEGEEFSVLILSYTRELSRPFKENKG